MAEAARDAGAEVILISGPVGLPRPQGVNVIDIESAQQLLAVAHANVSKADIFIAAAAVADYQPVEVKRNKIKKSDARMSIELIKAPDTLASVSALPQRPFCVGFAAETENVKEYAIAKMKRKNLDMIIANKVGAKQGFDCDDNSVEVFWPGGGRRFPTAAKSLLAVELIKLISEHYQARCSNTSDVAATATTAGD